MSATCAEPTCGRPIHTINAAPPDEPVRLVWVHTEDVPNVFTGCPWARPAEELAPPPPSRSRWETFDPRDGRPVHRTRFRLLALVLARLHSLDYAPTGVGWPPVHCADCGTRMAVAPEPWHTTDTPSTCGECRTLTLLDFLAAEDTETTEEQAA